MYYKVVNLFGIKRIGKGITSERGYKMIVFIATNLSQKVEIPIKASGVRVLTLMTQFLILTRIPKL